MHDGMRYTVEINCGGDVIRVFDQAGQKVADAEKDFAVEQIFCAWFTAEDGMVESRDGPRDLFDQDDPIEIARWLCAVHPNN